MPAARRARTPPFPHKGTSGRIRPSTPTSRAGGENRSDPVGEHHIGVGHENQGHRQHPGADARTISKILSVVMPPDSALDIGCLDDRALRGGVGEGDAQLDEVGSRFCHGPDQPLGGLQVRVAAGDEGNERLAVWQRPLRSYSWISSPLYRAMAAQSLSPRPEMVTTMI